MTTEEKLADLILVTKDLVQVSRLHDNNFTGINAQFVRIGEILLRSTEKADAFEDEMRQSRQDFETRQAAYERRQIDYEARQDIVDAEMAESRQEFRAEIAESRAEFKNEIAESRAEFKRKMEESKERVEMEMAESRAEFDRRINALLDFQVSRDRIMVDTVKRIELLENGVN